LNFINEYETKLLKKDAKFTIHSIFLEDSKSQPLQFNNNYSKK